MRYKVQTTGTIHVVALRKFISIRACKSKARDEIQNFGKPQGPCVYFTQNNIIMINDKFYKRHVARQNRFGRNQFIFNTDRHGPSFAGLTRKHCLFI
ncbi:hypothetical protein HanPSC8_Chr09g0377151 [Helianthus annuus]|nr:hypothetical protein HanPSC8_Chr09g0377151 [Helianthus annuus]